MTTPTPPKLERLAYWAFLTDPEHPEADPVPHHVEVRWADQVRGELEAGRHGINAKAQPLAMTEVWLWASMTRTGDYAGKFPEFRRLMAGLEPDREVMGDDDAEPDPTTPGLSDSV